MNCQMPRAPARETASRLESRFGLRQIDQILRNALLLKDPHHHVVVAAGAGESTLECSASAIGKITDIARDLIRHHQRQVGVGRFHLGLRLGLYVGVG